MKRLIILILIIFGAPSFLGAQVPVSFDEGVDLVALVWRLAGSREYNNCLVTPYAEGADSYFAPYKDHSAVKLAMKYSSEAGVAYDAVASFGLHLCITDDAQVVFDENLTNGIDERWTPAMQSEFLNALNDFYTESHFHDWYVGTESYMRQAEVAFLDVVSMLDLSWFDSFFGILDDASFAVKLCLLAGVNNYGLSVKGIDGSLHLTPVISSATYKDEEIVYNWNSVFPILVHEFCHTYCNPIIDANWDSIRVNAERVFEANKAILSSQAYTNGRIMMYETFVRASVIKYMKDHFTPQQVNIEKLISVEEEKGFLLTRSMYEALDSYNGDFTVLATAVNSFDLKKYTVAKKAAAKAAAKSGVKYKVNLKNKAKNVPAGEFTFTISFDRPMQNSVGINVTELPFPELKGFEWSTDFKTFYLHLILKPDSEYGFKIDGNAFAGQDGRHTSDMEIRFRTRK